MKKELTGGDCVLEAVVIFVVPSVFETAGGLVDGNVELPAEEETVVYEL